MFLLGMKAASLVETVGNLEKSPMFHKESNRASRKRVELFRTRHDIFRTDSVEIFCLDSLWSLIIYRKSIIRCWDLCCQGLLGSNYISLSVQAVAWWISQSCYPCAYRARFPDQSIFPAALTRCDYWRCHAGAFERPWHTSYNLKPFLFTIAGTFRGFIRKI